MIREIGNATCVIDPSGKVVWTNTEFTRWFKHNDDALAGRNIEEILPGLYKECTKGVILPFVDKHGLKHYIEARCDNINDKSGNLISISINIKDVTLLQVLLNISVLTTVTNAPQNLLEQAIGSISDTFGYRTIAALLLKDGYLELAASRGYSPMLQSMLSKQQISPDERGLAGRSAFHNSVITRQIKTGTVMPKLLKESRRLGIHWATTLPLSDRNGVIGVIAFSTSSPPDIDEIDLIKAVCNQITVSMRKILFEEQLINARRELELYVDLMCHDITNSIHIAMGYMELIEKEAVTADYEHTSCAISALHKMNRLIDNVRALRTAPGISMTSMPLLDSINGVLADIYCELNVSGKEIAIDLQIDREIYVIANLMLKDVIRNLLESTVRRLHNRGKITIRASTVDGMCNLHIEDTGPGTLKAIDLQHDTEVYRPGLSNSGTIGLYFVKQMIKGYRGQISFEERVPGQLELGNKVTVSFRLAGQEVVA